MNDRRRLGVHRRQHVADALRPAYHQGHGERLVVVGLHDFEEVLAANKLHDQMSALPLMNEIEDARHDGDRFERTQNLRFAPKEIEADGEFLRVVAEHVLDGHLAIALLGVGGEINRTEASLGKQLVKPIAAMEQRAAGHRQRIAAADAIALAGGVGDPAGRIDAQVRRTIRLRWVVLEKVAAVHASDGAFKKLGTASGAMGRRGAAAAHARSPQRPH